MEGLLFPSAWLESGQEQTEQMQETLLPMDGFLSLFELLCYW